MSRGDNAHHPSRKHSSSSLSSLSAHTEECPPTDSTESLITPVRSFSISKAELNLPLVLKCGQTFRWNQSKFTLENHDLEKPNAQTDSTDPDPELVEWSVAWSDRTIVLRQDDHQVHYVAIYKPSDIKSYQIDVELDTTYDLLKAYFVLDVSLVSLYQDWSKRDPNFSSKAGSGRWDGLRVCRQDGWETMVSFICSANNNIPRISMMLNRLCASFGTPMPRPALGITLPADQKPYIRPTDSGSRQDMYSFPTAGRLSQPDVPEKLKELGFGYRASYVYKSALKLCELGRDARRDGRWPGLEGGGSRPKAEDERANCYEPEAYLDLLAGQSYDLAHAQLVSQFPGIGPKVADCICLFGLGFVHVVPVDVHIYKIAARDYDFKMATPTKKANKPPSTPESPKRAPLAQQKTAPSSSRGKKSAQTNQPKLAFKVAKSKPSDATPTLSKLNYARIQRFLVDLWGPWAGWTQQILFLADLNKPPR